MAKDQLVQLLVINTIPGLLSQILGIPIQWLPLHFRVQVVSLISQPTVRLFPVLLDHVLAAGGKSGHPVAAKQVMQVQFK